MEFYSVAQTANKLGLCEETVRRWAKSGKIPNERKGRKYRFLKKLIDNFYIPKEVLDDMQ